MASAPVKKIGDRTYAFGKLSAIDALRVEVAIARVIGEPLFRAFMDRKKTGETQESEEAAAAVAVGMLTAKMNADELVATMGTVLASASCDGQVINDINNFFTGRNKELWQVFMEALKANFSDFLPEKLFASLAARVATGSSSSSPQT